MKPSANLICLVISLVLLFIAAFIGPPATDGPFYRRVNFGWAGMFFLVLASVI